MSKHDFDEFPDEDKWRDGCLTAVCVTVGLAVCLNGVFNSSPQKVPVVRKAEEGVSISGEVIDRKYQRGTIDDCCIFFLNTPNGKKIMRLNHDDEAPIAEMWAKKGDNLTIKYTASNHYSAHNKCNLKDFARRNDLYFRLEHLVRVNGKDPSR